MDITAEDTEIGNIIDLNTRKREIQIEPDDQKARPSTARNPNKIEHGLRYYKPGEDTIHAALALELLGAIVDWVSSP